MSFARSHLLVPALLLAFMARAAAFEIVFDYSYDATHGNYFATHEPARRALEQAAADLEALLATPLGAISVSSFNGTMNEATTTFDWSLEVTNPSTGLVNPPAPFSRLADTVVIHVGLQAFRDDRLGGAKIDKATKTINTPNTGTPEERVTATDRAAVASNSVLTRGAATVIGSYTGSIGTAPYSLLYGPLGGSIWFDSNIDNDNTNTADLGQLDQYWHFDPSTPVEAGKRDFYSAALREIVQTLGFGQSDAWTVDVQGTKWKGEYAAALFGGDGTGLIRADGQIGDGLGGASLFDGTWQLAALAPGLAAGERRYLTALDVAFLHDLGYQIVPEPGALGLVAVGVAMLGLTRRRARFRLV